MQQDFLVNRHFFDTDDNGELSAVGRVVGKIASGLYLVELTAASTAGLTVMRIVDVKMMMPWIFCDTRQKLSDCLLARRKGTTAGV